MLENWTANQQELYDFPGFPADANTKTEKNAFFLYYLSTFIRYEVTKQFINTFIGLLIMKLLQLKSNDVFDCWWLFRSEGN